MQLKKMMIFYMAALVALWAACANYSESTEINGKHVLTTSVAPECQLFVRPTTDGGVWVQTSERTDNCSMHIIVDGKLFTGMRLDSDSYDDMNGHTYYYVLPGKKVKVCVKGDDNESNCTEEFVMPPIQ